MASLALITLSWVTLEIFGLTCRCEFQGGVHSALYTEAVFPPKEEGVVYVPEFNPGCCQSCHHQPLVQTLVAPVSPEKILTGTYPANVGTHQLSYTDQSSQNYHLASDIASGKYHSGSATVYRQDTDHSTEHKTTVDHQGSGESYQIFRQTHQPNHLSDHGEKDHNVQYKFEYTVHDLKTGDVKRQREERRGDVVSGEYSLLEEDGNVRTVTYYADWKSGFHADVHNSKSRG